MSDKYDCLCITLARQSLTCQGPHKIPYTTLNTSTLLPVGRLLGTIRQQGAVKRTVIRGRVGARPAGMRLPPPMATQHTAPAKAPGASAGAQDKGDTKDKSETTAKEDDKVCIYNIF